MAGRFDLMRSLVRSAAKAGAERLSQLGPIANVRQVARELRERRASVTEGALSSAIARAPDVRATSVSLHDGRILVDVTYDDGENLVMSILPEKARFAPRGAKEVLFQVDPPERVGESRARDVVGCVAAAIARALWGPALGPREADETALVERDGARLRTDLRSVPAVRAVLEGGPLSMALDVLSIEAFTIEDRTLRLKIALPFPGAGS